MNSKQSRHRALFRFSAPWAWCFWIALVLVLALFVDRPVVLAVANGPAWLVQIGALLEVFGDSFYPIVGGACACLAIAVLALSFDPGRARRMCWSLLQLSALVSLAALWSGLCVRLLKAIFGRPRPIKFLEQGMYDWLPMQFQHLHVSMPSGHTVTVFSMAFVLCVMFPRARLAVLGFACLVGVGRLLYLQHWPSDVVIGAVLGWLFARGAAGLFVGSDRILIQRANGDYAKGPIWRDHAETVKRALKS